MVHSRNVYATSPQVFAYPLGPIDVQLLPGSRTSPCNIMTHALHQVLESDLMLSSPVEQVHYRPRQPHPLDSDDAGRARGTGAHHLIRQNLQQTPTL